MDLLLVLFAVLENFDGIWQSFTEFLPKFTSFFRFSFKRSRPLVLLCTSELEAVRRREVSVSYPLSARFACLSTLNIED